MQLIKFTNEHIKNIKSIILIICMVLFIPLVLFTQSEQKTDSPPTAYRFGGPNSVIDLLRQAAKMNADIDHVYFNFKSELMTRRGFSYGLDHISIGQIASGGNYDKSQVNGLFRAFFLHDLIGRRSGNVGSLVCKVENYHRQGKPVRLAQPDWGWG
jgi:hypothetical protein